MSGEIIRLGDKTSHGGTVVEGSQLDICMGKPIAFIGHKAQCPRCGGSYPIAEGVLTATFYGKGVAVAGMKTACGAVLIASQFTDVVDWSSGGGLSTPVRNSEKMADAEASPATAFNAEGRGEAHFKDERRQAQNDEDVEIEHFYTLMGADGKPMTGYRYDIFVGNKLRTKGGDYADGETARVEGPEESRFVTWLNRDGGLKG